MIMIQVTDNIFAVINYTQVTIGGGRLLLFVLTHDGSKLEAVSTNAYL